MQRVLDKYDYGAPQGVHLPALLRYSKYASFLHHANSQIRCTARMLIQELDNTAAKSQQGIDEICNLFNGG